MKLTSSVQYEGMGDGMAGFCGCCTHLLWLLLLMQAAGECAGSHPNVDGRDIFKNGLEGTFLASIG